ncbi:MAG TPA: NUDIX domain-containing protein [Flavipsychrobacter sp.]|nr:NUDIX domain-containing protein [Flavipsychrobacter sp.]
MNDGRFNVRMYGIWIHEKKVLINEELIRGQSITKFPGGGLHFGEGTIDGLKREWREELGLDIQVLDHFYTTDFFQPSAYDDSQVISIYYLVRGFEVPTVIVNKLERERTFWKALEDVSADTFSLPIDKIVGQMLQKKYSDSTL